MKTYYEKSLQKIKEIGKVLTKSQYNKIAKEYNLLSSESMEYISQSKFKTLVVRTLGKGIDKIA